MSSNGNTCPTSRRWTACVDVQEKTVEMKKNNTPRTCVCEVIVRGFRGPYKGKGYRCPDSEFRTERRGCQCVAFALFMVAMFIYWLVMEFSGFGKVLLPRKSLGEAVRSSEMGALFPVCLTVSMQRGRDLQEQGRIFSQLRIDGCAFVIVLLLMLDSGIGFFLFEATPDIFVLLFELFPLFLQNAAHLPVENHQF